MIVLSCFTFRFLSLLATALTAPLEKALTPRFARGQHSNLRRRRQLRYGV
jgi:hypothetical protein